MKFFKILKVSKVTNAKGFTLVEILIGLTLLAIAGTFVMGKVFDLKRDGEIDASKIQMKGLGDRLKEFRRDCNFYPTSEMGLIALVEKPSGGRECKKYNPSGYVDGDNIPDDPWGNPYIYVSDGKTFNITSWGPDGEEGGEGPDAEDISLNKKNDRQQTSGGE